MISKDWNGRGGGGGESISRRVMGTIRPDAPLKGRIEAAQKRLEIQISKLGSIQSKLQKKHDAIFERIVCAQRSNSHSYAKAYAAELSQVRKMRSMVGNAKLSMEQIQLRLNTVSELGDVVVTLSPCMSIIRGLSSSIGGIMPEANASMQDLSSMLGDVMNSSSVDGVGMQEHSGMLGGGGSGGGAEANSILAEAQSMLESQTKSSIPDVPSELRGNGGGAGQRRGSGTLI